MTQEAPPLLTISAGGREWKVGRLSALELRALMPELATLKAMRGVVPNDDEARAFCRVMLALLVEHAPELTVEKVGAMANVYHLLPVLNEIQRQALAVSAEIRAAMASALPFMPPAGRA